MIGAPREDDLDHTGAFRRPFRSASETSERFPGAQLRATVRWRRIVTK
jgi:hypothetical protein